VRVLQTQVARNKEFTSHGYMNIVLFPAEGFGETGRQDSRGPRHDFDRAWFEKYLSELIRQDAATGRERRKQEALERSFEQFQFRVGK